MKTNSFLHSTMNFSPNMSWQAHWSSIILIKWENTLRNWTRGVLRFMKEGRGKRREREGRKWDNRLALSSPIQHTQHTEHTQPCTVMYTQHTHTQYTTHTTHTYTQLQTLVYSLWSWENLLFSTKKIHLLKAHPDDEIIRWKWWGSAYEN